MNHYHRQDRFTMAVLGGGLPETALGTVLANAVQNVGWHSWVAAAAGTGSRYVAPRHFSRRSNLEGATSLCVVGTSWKQDFLMHV